MNHGRTYRPVPHVPASCLRDADGSMRQAPRRSAGHAAIHPVQPLKGLPGTRATDVSYRALAPGGAGFYRICAGISESQPTAHYSLPTANSTYTFSAKERDPETGLSYFGSRYYNSDLSVWLSVDPMTAKYPSLSPYTYCANNPVRCVDPNGEDYTNFEDENGKLLEHIEDGSNAVFKLNRSPIVKNAKTGKFEKNNNAYFAFSRYDQSQNGIDEVNVQSVIDYAQTYTRKTFTADGKQTYCNYAAKFIALSFNSAVTELGGVDMNVGFLTNSASGIYKHIPSALLLKNHEEAVNMAKSLNSYGLPNLVFASISGHILTFTSDGYYSNVGGKNGNTIQTNSWLKDMKDVKYFSLSPSFYQGGTLQEVIIPGSR